MTTITDYAGLVAIGSDLAGDYILGNDIDASGETWTPLGTFTGSLDGKDYKITDLAITINAAGVQYGALFLRNDGTIKNLGIEDCVISVTSTNNAAGGCPLVRDNRGTISNCWATGTVSSDCNATTAWGSGAGLVCINNTLGDGGTISECHSAVDVTVTSIGYASASGLVDDNWGDIDESYGEGNISATSTSAVRPVYAAGFVARNGYDFAEYEGIISDAYARGNATATGGGGVAIAGGFVAENDMASSTITNAYSTGIPTADDTEGGFCAVKTAGTITDCFWDEDTSGTAISDGGTGKTTAEMKTKSTFTDADWDFIVIWGILTEINDGYPFLWAIAPEEAESPRATVAIQDKITLESIRNIEMSARGRFRVNKDGQAIYRSRYARNA